MIAEQEKRNEAIRKRKERERQERIQREIQEAQVTVEQWKAGEPVRVPWVVDEVYLRVRDDVVETSKGAEVPLSHALRLLPVIRSGRTYQHNGHSLHLGHFRLDEIDAEGNIRAGCHFIKRAEIERVAQQLGL